MQLDFTKTSRDQNAICHRYASIEEANDGTFLETSFEVQHGRINYRLKTPGARKCGDTTPLIAMRRSAKKRVQ